MEKNEYIDNEKVLYKTRGNLVPPYYPRYNPQEFDCLVTEGHVLIEAEEPIKIPLSRIKDCSASEFTALERFSGRATLITAPFLDDLNKESKLTLEIPAEHGRYFKHAICKQIVGRYLDSFVERPQRGLFRDHTRDNICAGLQKLGIDAKMATRGRVEESICGSGSIGIIYIPKGPIRWVNVRKETYGGVESRSTYYYTEYGIHDPRLGPDSPTPYIRSVRKKSFPLFGQVVDVLWEGGDYGTGVISRLNNDDQLKEAIMKSRDVTIKALGDYGCWIMSTETRIVPSEVLFSCYQVIAQHLLAEWPSA